MQQYAVILLILPSLILAQCGPGAEYDEASGKCFMFYTAAVDHRTAESICAASKGHLSSIHSSAENTHLATMARKSVNGDKAVWIGAKASSESNFLWTDETTFDFNNYKTRVPLPSVSSQCMQFISESSEWQSADCNDKKPFLCSYDPAKVSSIQLAKCLVSHDCPSGYAWFDETNYCYKSVTVFKNFTEANKACVAEGAQLASIHSQVENDFLVELSKAGITTADVGWNNNVYIGLIYTDGTWKWTDGSNVDYLNWAAGEPNKMNIEFWTSLVADGHQGENSETEQWNNVANIDERAFICKKIAGS